MTGTLSPPLGRHVDVCVFLIKMMSLTFGCQSIIELFCSDESLVMLGDLCILLLDVMYIFAQVDILQYIQGTRCVILGA